MTKKDKKNGEETNCHGNNDRCDTCTRSASLEPIAAAMATATVLIRLLQSTVTKETESYEQWTGRNKNRRRKFTNNSSSDEKKEIFRLKPVDWWKVQLWARLLKTIKYFILCLFYLFFMLHSWLIFTYWKHRHATLTAVGKYSWFTLIEDDLFLECKKISCQ